MWHQRHFIHFLCNDFVILIFTFFFSISGSFRWYLMCINQTHLQPITYYNRTSHIAHLILTNTTSYMNALDIIYFQNSRNIYVCLYIVFNGWKKISFFEFLVRLTKNENSVRCSGHWTHTFSKLRSTNHWKVKHCWNI